jgi:hypothetical protein
LVDSLVREGYVLVRADAMQRLLVQAGALSDWQQFSDSWNALELDTYMADKGRYRRRRHAVFAATAQTIERQPHQPHYQTLDYNPLHGGIERWFEPVAEHIAGGACLQTILGFCRALFDRLAPGVPRWRIEVHQFRIEARAGEAGQPTPEGMHRDGVDYVLVLLINRRNIASGTTMIRNVETGKQGSFTLTEPFDAVLVDDVRVYHGVTPVQPVDPAAPAYRDVLVVTFRKN